MLALPTAIILVASLTNGENMVFPPHGLTFHWCGDLFTDPTIRNSLLHSLSSLWSRSSSTPSPACSRPSVRCGAAPAWRGSLALWIMTRVVVSAFAFYTVALDIHIAGNLILVGLGVAVVVFPFMLWTIGSASPTATRPWSRRRATMGADPVEQSCS